MLVGNRRRAAQALVAAIVSATAAACAASPDASHDLELTTVALEAERSAWVTDTTQVRFEVTERFGSDSAGDVFGRITAVAADSVGRLAIFDASDCSVTLLSADRTSRRRFGTCGDGPGELRIVGSMALRQDELVIRGAGLLQRFDTLGTEIARVSLSDLDPGGSGGMVAIDDSTLALAITIDGNEPDSLRSLMLVSLRDRSGTILRRAVRPPPISARNPEAVGDFLEICGGRRNGEPIVAVAQAWALQTVVLTSASFAPVSNDVTHSEWTGGVYPQVPGRAQPSLRPRLRAHAVQCLDFGTARWGRKTDWTKVPPEVPGSLLEVRDWDGRVLYRGDNPVGVEPGARPVAAWGNRLAYVNSGEVSELVVVAIVPVRGSFSKE